MAKDHDSWEYGTVEWYWDRDKIRVDLPAGYKEIVRGAYAAVVTTLTGLGHEGWEVITCTSTANFLFWTLKRKVLNTA